MPSGERPHVLLIYLAMIPSIRLCGHSQMEALARAGRIDYRACQEKAITRDDLSWADIVLLGRLDNRYERELAELLRRAGKYLIYILDDDLLSIPEGLTSAPHYRQPEIQNNIRRMMALSNAILSPSPLLLKKYATGGQRPLLTEEPSIHAVPYAPHDPDAPVKIGFAGSVDRTKDVGQILSDALRQIKRDYGDRVVIEFMGVDMPLARELNASVTPYRSSYDAYREALNARSWDIGLAPMPDTPFHACKHYNKFVEYAAGGIVGVFSDVEPYARLRREIGLGLFCENRTEAWVDALRTLIDDHERRENLRRQVCEAAAGPMSAEVIAERLWEDMADVWPWKSETPLPFASLRWMKLVSKFDRIRMLLKIHQGGIFKRLWQKLREQ